MNHLSHNISEWLAINELSLNVEETVNFNFGAVTTFRTILVYTLAVMNCDGIKTFKYLGIFYDSPSKWDSFE